MNRTADIVICGAGITGVAAAHFLSKCGFKNILLIDERPPLSFTSDLSTESYRNWWPDPEMLALLNRSIVEAVKKRGTKQMYMIFLLEKHEECEVNIR